MHRTLPLLACCLLAAGGCVRGGAVAAGARVRVVAGLYPLAFVAREVGGPLADVTDLTPSGAEPHDVELTAAQVGLVGEADVVLLVRGLQPALDDAAPRRRTLDAGSAGTPAPGAPAGDPHVWLDPVRMADLAGRVADVLARRDAEGAATYRANAAALAGRLRALHAETAAALGRCERREIVTGHAAFGQFAARYGLTQTGIAGVTPDAEPSPRRLAEIAGYVRAHGVRTIFAEALVSPKVADTVARETGARVAVLDPVEGVRGGDDYFSVLRRDVATLRRELGCA
ncbi:MAG TPA: metal ABC transporter substrate-binding protein [Mycobacteriales bacterium]|nr:metal ABC transporter substrate-binding protein [Mycobacteriales bacterium]